MDSKLDKTAKVVFPVGTALAIAIPYGGELIPVFVASPALPYLLGAVAIVGVCYVAGEFAKSQ
jgi:hypothetical protein